MKKSLMVSLIFIVSLLTIRSTTASPLQTGSISGQVITDYPITYPISGAWVYALDTNFDFVSGAYSQVDGSYQITGLDTGSYYVAVSAGGYGGVYYDNAYDDPSATLISVVESNDTPGIDFNLSPASTITGYVYASDGVTPLSDAQVQVWPINGGQIRSATSDSSGYYTVGGLSTGTYVAKAEKDGYVAEFWLEETSWNNATPIEVPDFYTVPGINFTLETAGSIAGIITERATGNPIQDVEVCRWDYDTGENFTCTSTAVDGSYHFYTDGGDYRIRSNKSGYSWQFFNDTTQWYEADRVSVTTGLTTSGIDFSLDPGGTISGYVYDSDGTTPLANMRTHIVRSNGTGWPACTDSNGYYSFDNVPLDIAWRVEAGGGENHCGGSTQYIKQYWDHTADWDEATTLTLNDQISSVSGINFALQLGGSISGSVTELDGGAPIANAWLAVFNTNFDYLFGVHNLSDGSYQISGLLPGSYYVSVSASGFGGVYYDNAYDDPLASQISVVAAADTPNINFQLSPEATISGHIYDSDGTTPLSDVTIEVWPENGGQIRSTTSQSDGSFSVGGLSTGHYIAKAELKGYTIIYYDDTYSWGTATPISVTQPFDTSGIDFMLELGGSISGVVYNQEGTATIGGGRVVAGAKDESIFRSTCANSDGTYMISGLPLGDYKVYAYGFCNADPNYVLEYWQEQAAWDTADIMTLVETSPDLDGIDFTLQLGGEISGRVLLADGVTPVENACVRVSTTAPEFSSYPRFWRTPSDGSFSLYGMPTTGIYLRTDANCTGENPELQDEWYSAAGSTVDAGMAEMVLLSPGEIITDVVFTLDIAASTIVSPEDGGVLTSTVDIPTTLTFPPGAVSEPVTLTFKVTTSLPISAGLQFVGQNFSIEAVTADGTPVTTFAEPFTITIHYSDEDVAGFDEESLTLNFWNVESGQWEEIPTTIDTETNTMTAVLYHLTDFAVIGVKYQNIYLPFILVNR